MSHLFYVKLLNENDIKILEKVAIDNNVEIIGKNIYMPLWYTLACSVNSKGNAMEMANLFFELGKFDAAEPDLMVDDLLQCVDDTYFDDQWHLNNDGQYGGTSGIDIDMCDAWVLTEGCDDIVVAVVDHGIELDHPDLLNMFANSYDSETNSSPSIVHGPHGTACAGIIGAASDNNIGVAGVAPGCQLMSVSNSMVGTPNSRQRRGDAINWAWHNGADVISNSWGSSVQYEIIDEAIDSALTYGRDELGCVVVFASGNDNSSVNYPANSNPDIIAVGAMSPCGERKSPSSCDTEDEWGSNYGTQLDLVAPGVLIPTTDRQGNNGYNPDTEIHVLAGGDKISDDYNDDDYTVWFNGTSSACPQVAGVAALILSVNPSLTQDEVRDIIESTCTKVGSYTYSTVTGRNNGTWNNQVGYGCVNAYAAVRKAGGEISGSNFVCYSGTSFSIENLPPNATITWSSSVNITRVSAQGSDPCTFRANSSTTSATGSILAIVTTDDAEITLPSKTVWVGLPSSTGLDISNPYNYPSNTLELDEQNQLIGLLTNTSTMTYFEWDYSGWSHFEVGATDNISFVTVPSSFTYKDVKIRACNPCDETSWHTERYYPGGYYFFSIFPNPANEYIELAIEPEETTINKDSKVKIAKVKEMDGFGDYTVEIWSEKGGKIKSISSKEMNIQLSTKDLLPGKYFVHLIVDGEIYKQQLLIE